MLAAPKKYMVLIFGEGPDDAPKHWTRYTDDKAEAVKLMDQAERCNYVAEMYKRFANCEYRRIY